MLVDSHCHLDKLDYENKHLNVADVIAKAKQRGVSHMLAVAVELGEFEALESLVAPFDNVFLSCGIHPLHQNSDQDEAKLLRYCQQDNVVAVGETGLDYFYSPDDKAQQQACFRRHIRVARKVNKPLIIHTRDAREDTLAILQQEGEGQVTGVLHCFTESLAMAKAAIEMGFYVSISGIVTFKTANELREVVQALPLDRLLVETDSPYLAPVPYRGEQNQPAHTRAVAEFVAQLKGVTLDELAQQTTANFFRLFNTAAPVE
ncbi:YchF/TatD family DNA exonuclease [Motilimonas cestriensis]|uniref:YchF/TatD family DNA exonuclease n=1 Tax=Motilimonas cestriensis TaxID=2742685 RepID=A0ABS8W8B9_9GAMM|nr:YchF/TatD family DNA exonuclease [Motilimonas cestriensis]